MIFEADGALEAALHLSEEVDCRRLDGLQRRQECDESVSAVIGREVGRLKEERASLETQLREHISHLHCLELSNMDITDTILERKRSTKSTVAQLQKLRQADNQESMPLNVDKLAETEIRDIRELSRNLEKNVLDTEADLQEVHKQKERAEFEIQNCRHALAVCEALYRSRTEQAHRTLSGFGTTTTASSPVSSSPRRRSY